MTTDASGENIEQSPVFQRLLADAKHIESDFYAFKEMYRRIWEKDHSATLMILKCHLVLEHYLTSYLEAANPASPGIATARLTFAQKVDLADHPQANFHFFVTGIKVLNSLRNKVVHRLDFVPTEDDLTPITEPVRIWRNAAGEPVPTGFGVLDVFTELVCGFMDSTTKMIGRHGNGAGLPGLLNWYLDAKIAEQSGEPESPITLV